MGKPRIELDAKRVEGLIHNGSPVSEIADLLGVSASTVRRKLRKEIAKASAARRIRLRKLQWESAEKGNVPMQIFLGKCELGQGEAAPEAEEKVILRRVVKRG